jgi:hypothetical protein
MEKVMRASMPIAVAAALALTASGLWAKEYPIGKPKIVSNMEVSAVYLQPIEMDPPGMMRAAAESDIHLEADIKATKGNANGFPEGDWMPYLVVRYELTKIDSGQIAKGDLMPMVASDGPHYGDNVKMFGPGKYHLKLIVEPPMQMGHMAFGRHVDKETGVGPWFKPFTIDYDFTYAGIGKKGGY